MTRPILRSFVNYPPGSKIVPIEMLTHIHIRILNSLLLTLYLFRRNGHLLQTDRQTGIQTPFLQQQADDMLRKFRLKTCNSQNWGGQDRLNFISVIVYVYAAECVKFDSDAKVAESNPSSRKALVSHTQRSTQQTRP